jgi:hypothetical protein
MKVNMLRIHATPISNTTFYKKSLIRMLKLLSQKSTLRLLLTSTVSSCLPRYQATTIEWCANYARTCKITQKSRQYRSLGTTSMKTGLGYSTQRRDNPQIQQHDLLSLTNRNV